MADPRVSVIIPAYNAARYIEAALASAFAQDAAPFEVIVVDDGSTDGTGDVAAAIAVKRPLQVIRQKNGGAGAARNTGVAAAQGEYLAFLDADDLWEPPKLRLQREYLLAHPEAGFVLTHELLFVEGGDVPPWIRPEQVREPHPAWVPSALMVRRETLDAVGMFDPRYRVGDDSDWFVRATDMRIPSAVLPEVLLRRRVHTTNITAQGAESQLGLLRLLRASIERKRLLASQHAG